LSSLDCGPLILDESDYLSAANSIFGSECLMNWLKSFLSGFFI